MLGTTNYSPLYSGVLFLLMWPMSAVSWIVLIETVLRRHLKSRILFLLPYLIANWWSYMFYFSMMSVEIAARLTIIPIVITILLKVNDLNTSSVIIKLAAVFSCVAMLGLTYGIYQANVPVVIAGMSIALFLYATRLQEEDEAIAPRKFLCKGLYLIATFTASFGAYAIVTKLFFSSSDYLSSQVLWSTKGAYACIYDNLRYIWHVLTGKAEGSSELFTLGIAAAFVASFLNAKWRRGQSLTTTFKWISLAMLCASPFLLGLYMGQPPIPRTQFAAPIAASFLVAYACTACDGDAPIKRLAGALIPCIAFILSIHSGSLNLRNMYTDDVRYEQELQYSNSIVDKLQTSYADELDEKPVVFVGKWTAPLNPACMRTDIYGRTLFEHDYLCKENAAYNTVRCAGFIQATAGLTLLSSNEEQQLRAVEFAKSMPAYPQDGSIVSYEDMIVINLGS